MGSLSLWGEGILLSLLFLTAFTLVISGYGGFNELYNGNYNSGLSDDANTQQLFIEYQDTAAEQIEGGEAEFDAEQGITIKSSWGLVKDFLRIIWRFITGTWIEQIVTAWGIGAAGTALAVTFRVLFFISIVAGVLYGLFKAVI